MGPVPQIISWLGLGMIWKIIKNQIKKKSFSTESEEKI
jgi:hypothetical protein